MKIKIIILICAILTLSFLIPGSNSYWEEILTIKGFINIEEFVLEEIVEIPATVSNDNNLDYKSEHEDITVVTKEDEYEIPDTNEGIEPLEDFVVEEQEAIEESEEPETVEEFDDSIEDEAESEIVNDSSGAIEDDTLYEGD